MRSDSPVITSSDGSTPIVPAECPHQIASSPHDISEPIWEIRGSPPEALSTNRPAFMIASSSASAHKAL